MKDDLPATGNWWKMEDGEKCKDCKGERLNVISRNVVLYGAEKKKNDQNEGGEESHFYPSAASQNQNFEEEKFEGGSRSS